MSDRETLDVDILIVGGGPAGLSAALRLAQLQKAAGKTLSIAVLEKAAEPGAHLLSGAVLDPRALAELIPDFESKGAPLASKVHEDRDLLPDAVRQDQVSDSRRRRSGITATTSSRCSSSASGCRALSKRKASTCFPGLPATELLMDGHRVVGVRTGDRGIGRHGEKREHVRAGRRHSREGDDSRRRRSRESHEAADSALAHHGRQSAAGVCARHQGAVGRARGPSARRHRDAHARISARSEGIRRRLHLRDVRHAAVGRLRRRTRLRGSDVRSARRVSAIQAASAGQRICCAAGR